MSLIVLGARRLQPSVYACVLLLVASVASAQQRPSPPAAPGGDVVATVGASTITLAQVDDRALKEMASTFGPVRLVEALYESRRAHLDEMIATMLVEQEAKARGTTPDALMASEVEAKAAADPVTDAEVTAWYQANPDRVQGAPLEQVRAPIKALLAGAHFDKARDQYVDTLKMKTPVKISLEPPREKVAEAGRPARGPEHAPIEMIEFSDFQCPFCLRAYPTLMKVLDTYGDQIRFVYRHYPLKNHPRARPAAEAAQCANEQGKFWPFHNLLFGTPGHLEDADLKKSAVSLGMNPEQFNACVDSHKYAADVDADIAAGDEAGVSGTPAFYINGRVLSGAQPFEAFKAIIDEELANHR
jgi:protein-disulfide isomerase